MEGIGTVAAIGGIILFLVLAYAVFMQRKRTPTDVARTERATRELHKEMDATDKRTDPDRESF